MKGAVAVVVAAAVSVPGFAQEDVSLEPWGAGPSACKNVCRGISAGSGAACRRCHFVTMVDGSRLSPAGYVAFLRLAPRPCRAFCTAAQHDALKRDPVAWSALRLIGEQKLDGERGDPGFYLELRNCSCGSTLAITLSPEVG